MGSALVYDNDSDLAAQAILRALQKRLGIGDAVRRIDGSDMRLQLATRDESCKLVELAKVLAREDEMVAGVAAGNVIFGAVVGHHIRAKAPHQVCGTARSG